MLLTTRHSSIVIRLGVELARSLQRLVVIFLVVPSPVGTLDRIHLVVVVARALTPEVITIVTPPIPTFSVVVVARALAPEVITIVMPPIPTFSVVVVVGATMVPVVETTTTVVSSRRLVGTSRIILDELFCIISVGVIFGRGKELGHRRWPFAQ